MTELISYQRVLKVALVTILLLGAPLSLLWTIDCTAFNVLPGLSQPLVAILGWEIFGFLALLFPLWLLESTKRVRRVSGLELPFSNKLAAFAFFIPFRQVVLPFSVLNSLMFRVLLGTDKPSKLLFSWSLAWITMFVGAIVYMAEQTARHYFVPWNLQVTMVYGAATVFCALGALIVLKFERNIARLEQ